LEEFMANNNCGRFGRESQANTILFLLREARKEDRSVEISEMMRAGISAFNGRSMDLGRRGYGIKNEMWRDEKGQQRSRYWLTYTPEQDAQ
jgi:hypothetical protein